MRWKSGAISRFIGGTFVIMAENCLPSMYKSPKLPKVSRVLDGFWWVLPFTVQEGKMFCAFSNTIQVLLFSETFALLVWGGQVLLEHLVSVPECNSSLSLKVHMVHVNFIYTLVRHMRSIILKGNTFSHFMYLRTLYSFSRTFSTSIWYIQISE